MLAVVGLAIAVVYSWGYFSPGAPVTVKLVNASSQPVAEALLAHPQGTEVANSIAVGETRVVTFPARGELAYSLVVRFADGKELIDGETYAEGGYTITETITDSGLKTEQHVVGY